MFENQKKLEGDSKSYISQYYSLFLMRKFSKGQAETALLKSDFFIWRENS